RLVVDAARLESAELPGSVVDIVLRRMEGLAPADRAVLGAAALIGTGSTLPLCACAADVSPAEAYAAIQQGLLHKLLQPARDGAWRFHHDRVQEACAKLIAPALRAPIHGRIARFL